MLDFWNTHPPALIVVIFFTATVLAAGRILPAQNVVAIVALIIVLSAIAEIVAAKTGVPSGPFFFTENLGALLFRLMPWPIPLIWVIALMNSRGVARLILRPWRETSHYGHWSTGLTCLLVVFFDLSLEPVARAEHFWFWKSSKSVWSWYGAPWVDFAAGGAMSLLILGIILPWLIDKKSANPSPRDFRPFIIWLLVMLLMILINAVHSYWPAVGVGFAGTLAISVFAWRNSRA